MTILQAGASKSGNFWLYKILQSIAKHGGLEQRSFVQNQPVYELAKRWDLSYKEQKNIDVLDIEINKCFYRISSIFRMPIEDIDNYIHQCSHVWTHSTFCERSWVVLPKFDKVVYIIRDPRDRAVSASRFAFTPYMKKYYPHGEPEQDSFLAHRLGSMMVDWMQHVGGYLKHKNDLQIHFVFYERLLHSFDTELVSLLQYLGIELDEKTIDYIKHEVDFASMKGENPLHVRKGRAGQWVQMFTDAQKRRAARIAGPMLKQLSYPTGSRMSNSLPCVPAQLSNRYIEKAIRRAGRRILIEKAKRAHKFITTSNICL